MRSFSLFFSVAVVFTISCTISCRSQKSITNNYLQTIYDSTGKEVPAVPNAVIQQGDILSIRVYSTALGTRPEIDAPYNLIEAGTGSSGFLVDHKGNIDYPQIGTLHVEGLTREELAEIIRKKFEDQLNHPSVIVRFVSYKVTILGEVRNPSTLTLPTENVTILEALGIAGDITDYGRKDNVKVIREVNGQREIGTINLTSDSMFLSPYYRLQQNDVILVDQTRRKRSEQERSELIQKIGITSSIITAIALILNLVK
jgi:polysaccharide biosynthesis/export protein